MRLTAFKLLLVNSMRVGKNRIASSFQNYGRVQVLKQRFTSVSDSWSVLGATLHQKYGQYFSDFCGHVSFLCLALSYLENDFMQLRIYAVTGISLSIIFQYYREKPLWIPIRWNSLFLLINAVMIYYLKQQSEEANNIPEEKKEFFTSVFEHKGMKPVEFMHLMAIAKRRECKKGEKLISIGKEHNSLHLVSSGRLCIKRPTGIVGEAGRNQFVGVMSYKSWEERNLQEEQSEEKGTKIREPKAPSSLDHVWGIPSHLGSYLSSWGWTSNNEESPPEKQTAVVVTPSKPSKRGFSSEKVLMHVFEENIATGANNGFSGGGIVHMKLDEEFEEEQLLARQRAERRNHGVMGLADVVCEEDCVVYSWNFRDLHDMIEAEPNIGFVFERCLSIDLNHKMSRNWMKEQVQRYRQLLSWVCAVEVENHHSHMITAKEKSLLMKQKAECGISDLEHAQILADLGWSEEEFDQGFKKSFVENRNKIVQGYLTLLRNNLEGQTEVSPRLRLTLHQYKLNNALSNDEHVTALKTVGWSEEDFELGYLKTNDDTLKVESTDASVEPEDFAEEEPSASVPALQEHKPVSVWSAMKTFLKSCVVADNREPGYNFSSQLSGNTTDFKYTSRKLGFVPAGRLVPSSIGDDDDDFTPPADSPVTARKSTEDEPVTFSPGGNQSKKFPVLAAIKDRVLELSYQQLESSDPVAGSMNSYKSVNLQQIQPSSNSFSEESHDVDEAEHDRKS